MPKYVPHGDICSIRAVRLPVSSRKVKQLRHFSYIFFCGGYSESEKQTNKQTQKTFKGRSWLERLKQIPAEKTKPCLNSYQCHSLSLTNGILFALAKCWIAQSLHFPHKGKRSHGCRLIKCAKCKAHEEQRMCHGHQCRGSPLGRRRQGSTSKAFKHFHPKHAASFCMFWHRLYHVANI